MKDMKTQIKTDLTILNAQFPLKLSEYLYLTLLQNRAQNLRIVTENHSLTL